MEQIMSNENENEAINQFSWQRIQQSIRFTFYVNFQNQQISK